MSRTARLHRRDFLRLSGAGVLALAAARLARAAKDSDKPNIVFILADDLGYGDLSCYGQTKFSTPNIDRLAAEGVKFTDHYSGSTVCAPSRCCLMTGKHTGHAFIRGNKELRPEGQHPIPADTVTIAKLLKKAGYATGMFGKWGLGGPGTEGDPVKQGFDEFFGYNCQRHAHSYYVKYLWHNTKKVPLDGKTYSADLIASKARAFIRANKDKPFFCYIPTTVPHASLHVPEESAAAFRKKFPQFEEKIGRYAGPTIKNPAACFAGMVTRMDAEVGKILALLKELDLDRKTIVMFTSDNGPHLEGGHMPRFFNSNGPLKGHKRDLTEGGIRAPLLARWPGRIKPGRVSHHASAFWDMMPTFCHLAGFECPEETDGISMYPELTGCCAQEAHEYLYWEYWQRGGIIALRKGDWKAIRFGAAKNPDAPLKLYNLKDDLGETTDVAAKHPKIVAELGELMAKAHRPNAIWGPRGPKAPSPRKRA